MAAQIFVTVCQLQQRKIRVFEEFDLGVFFVLDRKGLLDRLRVIWGRVLGENSRRGDYRLWPHLGRYRGRPSPGKRLVFKSVSERRTLKRGFRNPGRGRNQPLEALPLIFLGRWLCELLSPLRVLGNVDLSLHN